MSASSPTQRNPATIDEYVAGFPADVQKILKKFRSVIRKAAPDAKEAITYRIPTFVQNGHLVFFAGFTKHVSLYPRTKGMEKYKKQIAPYASGRGTLKFPLGEPIPFDLIAELVKVRLAENLAAGAKKKAPPAAAKKKKKAAAKKKKAAAKKR